MTGSGGNVSRMQLALHGDLVIGLLSDTHIPESRPSLWPQVLAAFGSVDLILHAGDLHDVAIIDQLAGVAPTFAARGNGEDGSGGRAVQPAHARLRPAWLLELDDLTIGLIHDVPIPEQPPFDTVAKALDRDLDGSRPDVLVYGHTHVERIDVMDGILCVNPGSATLPHNLATQLGTIGFLSIIEGVPRASIFQLTDNGVEPFDWTRWRRA
jgi:uncharacterized protein